MRKSLMNRCVLRIFQPVNDKPKLSDKSHNLYVAHQVEQLEQRLLMSGSPLITEFMASNNNTLLDGDGQSSDWIEVYNPTDSPIDLAGWFLTDNVADLQKWAFPDLQQSELNPGEFLVVFASGQNTSDYIDAQGNLHTNFKLTSSGEYLALAQNDQVVVSEFHPQYPPQSTDVSYGVFIDETNSNLIAEGTEANYIVPTGPLANWNTISFDDSLWSSGQTGIGYDENAPATYDFGTATGSNWPGTTLNGNDNWINIGGSASKLTARHDSENLEWFGLTGNMGYMAQQYHEVLYRSNNADFSYNITDDTTFSMEYDIRISNTETGWHRSTEVGVHRSSDGLIPFQFGIDVGATPKWAIHTAAGDVYLSDAVPASSGSEVWYVRIDIDRAANGGQGSATLFAGQNDDVGDGGHAVLVDVPGLIGVNLHLNDSGTGDASTWDGLYIDAASGASFDNIVISKSLSEWDYADLIETTVPNGTRSFYTRQTFNIEEPATISTLKLNMRYDDGFVAYINGVKVAQANAPANPQWNDLATANHPDSAASDFIEFDISNYIDYLVAGENVLAIQAMNQSGTSSDMLIEATLTGSLAQPDTSRTLFMTTPTPGTWNVVSGPRVSDVTENPDQPNANEDLVIHATVIENGNGINQVNLHSRVDYSSEFTVQMLDDGVGADAVAGDDIYTAVIDSSHYAAGDMVRWYVTAEDNEQLVTRVPIVSDIDGQDRDPEYFGTVIADPAVDTALPVFNWFTTNPSAARSRTGTQASVYYLGEFYDNIFVRQRGQSSNAYTAKKSLKFDFNNHHPFLYDPEQRRVEEINLNNNLFDKSYVRQTLAWETFAAADAPYSTAFLMRLQLNGQFYSVQTFVEQVDQDYLKRNGLDPDGALYKATQAGNNLQNGSISNLEKKTRLDESDAQLIELVNGIKPSLPQAQRTEFVFDHVDIPSIINYMAAQSIIHGNDHMHKNYYLYQDTDGTGEWSFLPWDLDMSFGHNFASREDLFFSDDLPGGHPYFGGSEYPRLSFTSGNWNGFIDTILNTPGAREMLLRRIRTLMDSILQAPGTPAQELQFETRLDDLYDATLPDVLLDDAAWDEEWGVDYTHQQNIDRIKNLYLAVRRTHLFETHNIDNYTGDIDACAGIPHAQPADATLKFGTIEFNPASTNQDQEYIVIHNPNNYAVDISNWTLEGGVTHTFKPGTVITANGDMYLTPDSAAFRSRTTGPSGNQGLLVQSSYNGHLSNFGETLTIKRTDGTMAAEISYAGDPSPQQLHLRVTEIHYNPTGATATEIAAGFDDGDMFEFIELLNTSATETLDLAGVNFSTGITFTFGATSLLPGERIVAVSNQAAFEARYGTEVNIAGQYAGLLSNSGEPIKFDDATNSTIQSFEYDDSNDWPSLADGQGSSLVIVDTNGDYSDANNWDSSFTYNGTPGGPPQSIILGDITGDGLVNGFDVDPFVNVLLNGPYNAATDMNGDGSVNGFDVDPFVNAVLSGSSAPAPVEETTEPIANAPIIINNFASETEEAKEDQNDNPTPLIDMLPILI